MRHSTIRFALCKPCWKLPESGHVRTLLTSCGEGVGSVDVAPAADGAEVSIWKRMRLTKKTDSSLVRHFGDSYLMPDGRWKKLCSFYDQDGCSAKRGRLPLLNQKVHSPPGLCTACLLHKLVARHSGALPHLVYLHTMKARVETNHTNHNHHNHLAQTSTSTSIAPPPPPPLHRHQTDSHTDTDSDTDDTEKGTQ